MNNMTSLNKNMPFIYKLRKVPYMYWRNMGITLMNTYGLTVTAKDDDRCQVGKVRDRSWFMLKELRARVDDADYILNLIAVLTIKMTLHEWFMEWLQPNIPFNPVIKHTI